MLVVGRGRHGRILRATLYIGSTSPRSWLAKMSLYPAIEILNTLILSRRGISLLTMTCEPYPLDAAPVRRNCAGQTQGCSRIFWESILRNLALRQRRCLRNVRAFLVPSDLRWGMSS